MDSVTVFEFLDKGARLARRLGLRRVTRLGRHLAKRGWSRDLTANFDGFTMVASVEHRGHLYGLRKGQKEAFSVELFKGAVKPGHVVLDIGAHIAQYTLLAARQVGPEGKVIAFEPDPRSLRLIHQNVEINGFTDRVTIVPNAVSDTAGTASFFPHDSNPGRSSLAIPNEETRLKPIITERIVIDEYIEAGTIVDVIKMDIEGAEVLALKGMEQTIARGNRELTMLIECNPESLLGFGASAQMLLDQLRTMGFRPMIIDEDTKCLRPISEDTVSNKVVNLWCNRG